MPHIDLCTDINEGGEVSRIEVFKNPPGLVCDQDVAINILQRPNATYWLYTDINAGGEVSRVEDPSGLSLWSICGH